MLRALTRTPPKELAGVIERQVPQEEIKEAWHQLFTFFNEVEDKTQKKNVDIARKTICIMIDDILKQLSEYDRSSSDAVRFVIPWDYTTREFETENEYRNKLWEQQKTKETNLQIEGELVSSLEKWSQSIVNIISKVGQNPSYANVASTGLFTGLGSSAGVQAAHHVPVQQHLAPGGGGDSHVSSEKSRTRGYNHPVPVKGTGCDEMNFL